MNKQDEPAAAGIRANAATNAAAQQKMTVASRIHRTLALIGYGFLLVLILVLFLVFRTGLSGWLVALPLFAASAFIQYLIKKKGCATGFVIYFLTAAAILIVFFLTTA
jgi:hypothetical protein